jgi:hypothetical protein
MREGVMERPQRGLVVTDNLERAAIWMSWLHGAGYTTAGCVGPGLTLDCPRMHGGRCVLREVSDVAIVDLACDEDADLCTKVPDEGSSVFVRRGSPSEPDRRALMSSMADVRDHVDRLRGSEIPSAPATDRGGRT